jgi:hypothetical protein
MATSKSQWVMPPSHNVHKSLCCAGPNYAMGQVTPALVTQSSSSPQVPDRLLPHSAHRRPSTSQSTTLTRDVYLDPSIISMDCPKPSTAMRPYSSTFMHQDLLGHNHHMSSRPSPPRSWSYLRCPRGGNVQRQQPERDNNISVI